MAEKSLDGPLLSDVDEAFDHWTATFGHAFCLREDAFNALCAAKHIYAEGDPRRKREIDAYVELRLRNYLVERNLLDVPPNE